MTQICEKSLNTHVNGTKNGANNGCEGLLRAAAKNILKSSNSTILTIKNWVPPFALSLIKGRPPNRLTRPCRQQRKPLSHPLRLFFRHGLTFKQKFRRPLSKDKKSRTVLQSSVFSLLW
jgi:hypothetical protein